MCPIFFLEHLADGGCEMRSVINLSLTATGVSVNW